MREIQDLEHFVLKPGETLILRCKRHVSEETLTRMRESVAKLGNSVIVLPPDIEAFAGKIEVFGVDHGKGDDAPTQDDIDAARKQFTDAYAAGRVVWACEGDQWFVVHRALNPHYFDWNKYEYRLTDPKGN